MIIAKRTMVCVTAVIALLASDAATAEPVKPLPGNNVALGKKATFTWPPNQPNIKGGDETDLTDGKLWQSYGTAL